LLTNDEGETKLIIEHPENIQLYHVQTDASKLNLQTVHPSWKYGNSYKLVMDKIVGNIIKETALKNRAVSY
jgi:hypothetical protein